jgi:hypothetical protein
MSPTGRRPHPTGWTKWTHREQGGDYTFLTVARGTGEDHGVEFAYYLGLDQGSGTLRTFVRRLEEWHRVMTPLDDDGLDDLI